MERTDRIKQALERTHGIFAAKPNAARVTKTGRATLVDGMLCQYTEGDFTVHSDQPEVLGGEGKALTPGGYLRAGLSLCLAQGYVMRAIRRGIALHKVEVDIEADVDMRSVLGFAGVPCGFAEFRFKVRVESDAPEAAVRAVIDEADGVSPVLECIRRAQRIVRSVAIARPETV
jgi:uncharacterized OsmC-like protein